VGEAERAVIGMSGLALTITQYRSMSSDALIWPSIANPDINKGALPRERLIRLQPRLFDE
jgi:hypothetical protein